MRLTSASGLLRAGNLEGTEALEACYAIATEHRLTTIQFRAASHLATFLRDAGRTAEGGVWQQKASAAFDQLGGCDKMLGFFSNCVLFAIASANFDVARQWVGRALSEIPLARVGHAGLHFRALELRIKQLVERYDCSEPELADLLDSHVRYRGFGHHDEVMEAVWHALARKAREREGDVLLEEYLRRYRRFPA
jgi:hypothetical protein